MREMTEKEKKFTATLLEEAESIRMAINATALGVTDPSTNTACLIIILKEILVAVKELKDQLGVPKVTMAEDVKKVADKNRKQAEQKLPQNTIEVKEEKPLKYPHIKKHPVLSDKAISDIAEAIIDSPIIDAVKKLQGQKPIVVDDPEGLPDMIKSLFSKPEEAKSVIREKLVKAGCVIPLEKLVEMGYIENVRRHECRPTKPE